MVPILIGKVFQLAHRYNLILGPRTRIFRMVSLTFAMQSLASLRVTRIFVYELTKRQWCYLQILSPAGRSGLKLSERLSSKLKTWAILLRYLFLIHTCLPFPTNF